MLLFKISKYATWSKTPIKGLEVIRNEFERRENSHGPFRFLFV
jgi:hypothetical protein